MKPTLLLDVDGVLNPLHAEDLSLFEPLEDVVGAWRTQAAVYHSKFNHQRLELLAARFGLVWCTGWEDRANEIIGPAHGLPELPVIRFGVGVTLGEAGVPVAQFVNSSWKLPWIAKWLIDTYGEDQPAVAWLDDQIETGDREWAKGRNLLGWPTLCVQPDPTVGLTDIHVRHLLQWASDLQVGEIGEVGSERP